MVTLWRPAAKINFDTAHDTAHEKKFIDIQNMPHRLIWILEEEMSRSQMMAKLEKKQKYRLTEKGIKEKLKIKNDNQ